MIQADTEVLTKEGWIKIKSCEAACIENGSIKWSKIAVSKRSPIIAHHVYGRHFGCCIEDTHKVPAIGYMAHVRGKFSVELIHAKKLTDQWILTNTFDTQEIKQENPYLPFVCSFTKKSLTKPAIGELINGAWTIKDDAQFRLIPDIVKYQRYDSLLKWHGRDYVEDMNGRPMRGTYEFVNYNVSATDCIELAALGANKRVERINKRHLRVHDRWGLRVEDNICFESDGVSVEGDCQLILTRYQGKIAIVTVRDKI